MVEMQINNPLTQKTMVKYEVRFNDGEKFLDTLSLEEAIECRNKNNFRFLSRSLHIYQITTWNGWEEHKLV